MIYFCYVVFALVLIAFRVLLVVGVKNEIPYRETNSKALWIALTAVMGLISAVSFAIFTEKKEKNPKGKYILLGYFGLIIFAILIGVFVYSPAVEKAEEEGITSFKDIKNEVVYFQNDEGVDVTYDKMGNEYTIEQYMNNELKYYTKDGEEYVDYYDEDNQDMGNSGIINVETGERIPFGYMSDKDYFIGEDGYLYIYDDDLLQIEYCIYCDDETSKSVYYNKDGMLLYYTHYCNWDKDGNMVLNNSCYSKDLTYEDIPKSEIQWYTKEEMQELMEMDE